MCVFVINIVITIQKIFMHELKPCITLTLISSVKEEF